MILWSKLRRSRGFGIHSPFAYDLVLRTLRERDRYYAYTDLERMRHEAAEAGGRDLPSASVLRLIVRLVARFRPKRVIVSGDRSGLLSAAVTGADDTIKIGDPEATMVILSGRDDAPEAVEAARRVVMRGGVAFLLDRRHSPEAVRIITAGMERGMTFTSRHKLLAVGARHLPRQNFEINY